MKNPLRRRSLILGHRAVTAKHITVVLIGLVLTGSAAAATISGMTTAAGGTPLPSMTVVAYGSTGTEAGRTSTDASGRYSLILPAGTYRVLAFDPQGTYATGFYNEASSFETSNALTLAATDDVTANFILVRAGRLTGVVHSTEGTALSSMIVAAYNEDGSRRGFTMTDSAGGYTLVLPPGTYRVAAYDDTAVYAVQFFREKSSFESADRITVTAGFTTGAVDFSLPQSARISGRVTDAATGSPLGGIMLTAFSGSGRVLASAKTATDGSFDFAVPPAAFRLTASDPAGIYATSYYVDASSFEAAQPFDLAPGQHAADLDVRMVKGGRVTGQVRDANGAPIGGAIVTAYNPDGSRRGRTITGEDGRYSIVLPPGSFVLGAHDDQLRFAGEFYSEAVSLGRAHVLTVASLTPVSGIDFSLALAGRLSGTTYRASDGAPLAAMVITAWNGAGQPVSISTSREDGTFTLAVPPGTYRVVAHDPNLQFATTYFGGAPSFASSSTIVVAAEQDIQNLLMPMADAGWISGRLVSASNGAAIQGASIYVFDTAGNEIVVQDTDRAGEFMIPLPPGNYKLAAADRAGRFATVYYIGASHFASASSIRVVSGEQSTLMISVEPSTARRRRPAQLP